MTKTYEKYKDSGVAWIGEIPSEWKVARIKNIYNERTELSETGNERLLSVSEYYGVAPTSEKIEDNDFITRAKTLVGYKKCYKNDFVSNIMLAWKGSFGTTEYDGIVSPAYCVYKPVSTISSRYYHYLFRTDLYKGRFKSYSKGIIDSRLRLYSPFFYLVDAIFPPLSEQQSIASFLDEKCGEIDSLIALQEEMITELQDYKQSVISEVVTKGLDPNVKMKDSGIEWIGEIPEGWKVYPFKSIFKTSKGLNITKADLTEKGIPVINYGQIHSKNNPGTRIIKELIRYVPEKYIASNPECLLPVGSILFADTSEDIEGCGNAVYIDQSDIIFAGYHTVVAKPNNSSNKYIAYQLLTDCWRSQIRSVVNGIKVLSINQKFINSTSIIFPPLSEQQQIATYLDEKTQQIDTLITLKQQKIEELKDYKKSIIYEYVTGKKKV